MKRVIFSQSLVLLLVLSVTLPLWHTPFVNGQYDHMDYVSFVDHLDAEKAWNTVDDLAGDRFEGRRAGTQGASLASQYIANYFDTIGLGPPPDRGRAAWRSVRFSAPLWQLTQMPSLATVDEAGGVLRSFEYRKDFCVQLGSGSGDYTTSVTFVGYGMTAETFGYDDYAGVSTQGKVALAIVGTPPSMKEGMRAAEYGTWYSKAENAIAHGAVGLILADSPANPTPHYVERWRSGIGRTYSQLAILWGTIDMADELLKDRSVTLSSLQDTINQSLKPKSFALTKRLHVSVQVSITHQDAYNVLGYIPGSDPHASDKVVIIGAHYDHWGKDVDGSIFRGADDDASGVAVMMEIARLFSVAAKPRWTILFVAWSGEEEGLYGAYSFVKTPYVCPLSGIIAYLDLDMVGYGQQLRCEISDLSETLRAVMDESAKQLNTTVGDLSPEEAGGDNIPFEENAVPNLMFVYWGTPNVNAPGGYEFYHTPLDTADHVSREDLLETAKLTALITLKLTEATVTTTQTTTQITSATTASAQLGTGVPFTNKVLIVVGITSMIIVAAAAFYFRRRQGRI